jgi:hypothetical protein
VISLDQHVGTAIRRDRKWILPLGRRSVVTVNCIRALDQSAPFLPLTIVDRQNPHGLKHAMSDASGTCVLSGIPWGTYEVHPAWIHDAARVTEPGVHVEVDQPRMGVALHVPEAVVLAGTVARSAVLHRETLLVQARDGLIPTAQVSLLPSGELQRWSLTARRASEGPREIVVLRQGRVIWGPEIVHPSVPMNIDLTKLNSVRIRPTLGVRKRLRGWIRVVPVPALAKRSVHYLVLDPATGAALSSDLPPGRYEVLYYLSMGGEPAARSGEVSIQTGSEEVQVELRT